MLQESVGRSGQTGHGVEDAMGEDNCALGLGAGGEDDELLTPEAGDEIVGAADGTQNGLSDGAETGVARDVSGGVVVELEVVDVDEQEGELAAGAGDAGRKPSRERVSASGSV